MNLGRNFFEICKSDNGMVFLLELIAIMEINDDETR